MTNHSTTIDRQEYRNELYDFIRTHTTKIAEFDRQYENERKKKEKKTTTSTKKMYQRTR